MPNPQVDSDHGLEQQNLSRSSTLCSFDSSKVYRTVNHRDEKLSQDSFHASFVAKFRPQGLFEDVDLNQSALSSTHQQIPWYRRLSDLVANWWLGELFSWVLAATCMGTIALLLGLYDGQTMPANWPLEVTLNAYISILAAVAKYSLAVPVDEALGQLKYLWFCEGQPKKLLDYERFDDASRGPWGSLALLLHNKGRQLIATPQRPTLNGRSSVPRSVRFNTKEPYEYINGTRTIIPDLSLMMQVEPYFYGNGSIPSIQPFCPTAKCTWPTFQTLGVCSACEDVTELLEFACLNETGSWRDDNSIYRNATSPGVACGWFLNATGNSPVLMSGYALDNKTRAPTKALISRQLRLMDFVNPLWGGSLRFKATKDVIFDWMTVASSSGDSVYANQTPIATECVLHWCSKSISAAYEDGRYNEEVISTSVNESGHSMFNGFNTSIKNSKVVHLNYLQDIHITPPGQQFSLSVSNVSHLQGWITLAQYAPSHMTQSDSTAIPQIQFWTPSEDGPTSVKPLQSSESPWAPPHNVSLHVANLARGLTQLIRSYSNSTDPVLGYGSMETYFQIRWAWFALPVILLVSTLIFLVITIWRGRELDVWKNSSIAALANGLDMDTQRHLSSSGKLRDMLDKASDVEISLVSATDWHGLRSSSTFSRQQRKGLGKVGDI
ncbi:hypothetical protein EJ08DRAFT_660400 [Tothia fuscella]|uniref:DUF3176 domain containing protein n=1 Tax=Tothia fuscella TaxID=1048955 RepID=A0A9P4TZK2_9PEZI|nr:hypothetical protein EJ08DRAFT_660400 [Tothia fuscella]